MFDSNANKSVTNETTNSDEVSDFYTKQRLISTTRKYFIESFIAQGIYGKVYKVLDVNAND